MFLPGALSGLVSVLLGHPFDTVKIRVQTRMYTNSTDCFKQTFYKEGIAGLYRGALAPINYYSI